MTVVKNRKGNAREVKKIESVGFVFDETNKVWKKKGYELSIQKQVFTLTEKNGLTHNMETLDSVINFFNETGERSVQLKIEEVVSETKSEQVEEAIVDTVLGNYDVTTGNGEKVVVIKVAGYEISTKVIPQNVNKLIDTCNGILSYSCDSEIVENDDDLVNGTNALALSTSKRLVSKGVITQEEADGFIATVKANLKKAYSEFVPVETPKVLTITIGGYELEIPKISDFNDIRRSLAESINYICLNPDVYIEDDADFAENVIRYIESLVKEFTYFKVPFHAMEKVEYDSWFSWGNQHIYLIEKHIKQFKTA